MRGTIVDAETGTPLADVTVEVVGGDATGATATTDDDGRYTLIYNGEIYNHATLRGELSSLGERFHGSSDTEVLLKAYARWGKGCLERLRGMFAFAVWDRDEQRLFLARDRLGIKPLYYVDLPGRFLFASEFKSIVWSAPAANILISPASSGVSAVAAAPRPTT